MEDRKDTGLDSWDSGDDRPDIIDHTVYDADVSEFPVADEGDEDDLGVPLNEDGAQDLDNLESNNDDVVSLDIEPLDDSEYNDNSFDCD